MELKNHQHIDGSQMFILKRKTTDIVFADSIPV